MSERIKVKGVGVHTHCKLPKPVHNPLNRPPVSYKKPLISLIIFLLGLIGTAFISWVAAVIWTAVFLCVILKRAVIWLIHLYQNKAPDKVRLRCVFEPSCSEYALIALERWGAICGTALAVWRILRCNPFGKGGYDPVPERRKSNGRQN